MKQTITFHDKRKHSKSRQDGQNLNLKIEQNAKKITVTLEKASGKTETCIFPLEIEAGKEKTDTFPPEKETGKAQTCTFPLEDRGTDGASWFDHIETVASDAPLEYSGEYFSVCDFLEDLAADDEAFRILADAIYSMSGLKMTKPLAAMMGNRTLMELVSALDVSARNGSTPDTPARNGSTLDTPARNGSTPDSPARNGSTPDTPARNGSTPHPAGDSGVSRKTPENALQILNAELNKISKK